MARLRLAAVQLDEGSFDAALASLSADPLEDYRLAYADLKGDVLFAQGKAAPDQARAAYAAALELAASPNDAQIRELIRPSWMLWELRNESSFSRLRGVQQPQFCFRPAARSIRFARSAEKISPLPQFRAGAPIQVDLAARPRRRAECRLAARRGWRCGPRCRR